MHTTSFLDITITNLFHNIYFSVFGLSEKEKHKKLVISKQDIVKVSTQQGQHLIADLSFTVKSFLKIQQTILHIEQKSLDKLKIELNKQLTSTDNKAKVLYQQEIDEIKQSQLNLYKQLRELEVRLNTFQQVNLQPVINSYNTQKSPLQIQLNQLNDLEKQEIEKINDMLKNNLANIHSILTGVENQHKAKIDQELGLNDIKSLNRSFKKNYLIAKNAPAIFGGTPKNVIDNLRTNGIISADDFTDIASMKGDIKKSNGRWIKVPNVGTDRAIRLKMWLDKIDVECQQYIIDLQKMATQRKAGIHKLMVVELNAANDRKAILTNQAIEGKNNISQKYSGQKQTLIQSLHRLQNECDKSLLPIKQEFERLRAETMSLNEKCKAEYEQQLKHITDKYDNLHRPLELQVAVFVKDAEAKVQSINQDTQKKLIDHLNDFTNYHQEAYRLAVTQADQLKKAIVELEDLQKAYLKLI